MRTYTLSTLLLLLLVADGSSNSISAAISNQTLVPQDQLEEISEQEVLAALTIRRIPCIFRVLSSRWTTALVCSLRAYANRKKTCQTKVSASKVTTQICSWTSGGFKYQTIVQSQNGKQLTKFCRTVNGIPCKDSYLCKKLPNGSWTSYVDCRNTPARALSCSSWECNGKCRPKLNDIPIFCEWQ